MNCRHLRFRVPQALRKLLESVGIHFSDAYKGIALCLRVAHREESFKVCHRRLTIQNEFVVFLSLRYNSGTPNATKGKVTNMSKTIERRINSVGSVRDAN